MSTFIDANGHSWTRSDDRSRITRSDGECVIGNAEMTDEHLVNTFYSLLTQQKTDAERIAELEAKISELVSKLSQ